MLPFLLSLYSYTIDKPGSYTYQGPTLFNIPSKADFSQYLVFFNNEELKTNSSNSLQPVYKNIQKIQVNAEQNQTIYLAYIEIPTFKCRYVDFYMSNVSNRFEISLQSEIFDIPKTFSMCLVFPTIEKSTFTVINRNDFFGDIEYYESTTEKKIYPRPSVEANNFIYFAEAKKSIDSNSKAGMESILYNSPISYNLGWVHHQTDEFRARKSIESTNYGAESDPTNKKKVKWYVILVLVIVAIGAIVAVISCFVKCRGTGNCCGGECIWYFGGRPGRSRNTFLSNII